MKTLGILGGMGPKATVVLYNRIVDHTCATKDQEHINTIIASDTSIPDRTGAILSGDTTHVIAALTNAARKLDKLESDVIIMPCNTAHAFIDNVREASQAEILDMPELAIESALALCEGIALPRIGIMATDGTLASGVYASRLASRNAQMVIPSEAAQKDVMSLIYDDIKAGLDGDESKFERICDDFDGRADAVILACTELSVYKDNHDVPDNYIDAMDSLVEAAITKCGAQYI